MVRIVYSADVHGSEEVWLKFLNSWKEFKADILMMNGDLTGKKIIPIVDMGDGTWRTPYIFEREWVLRTEEEIKEMERRIRFAGMYPWRCTYDEVMEMARDQKRQEELFDEIMAKEMERWLRMVEEKGPMYMRIGRDFAPRVYEDEDLKIGKIVKIVEGEDILLAACGVMVWVGLEVSRMLKESGISAALIDVHTIKPLDKKIRKMGKKFGRIVTLEEHSTIGGLGSAICEIVENAKVTRIGVEDKFGVCSKNYLQLLDYYNLTPKKVFRKIMEVVK